MNEQPEPELNGSRIACVLYVAARDPVYATNLQRLTDAELWHCWHREWRKTGRRKIGREMFRREASRKAVAS